MSAEIPNARRVDLGRAAASVAQWLPEIAPDGSRIRSLLVRPGASWAQCTLRPGRTSKAIVHRTVEEVWRVTHGLGRLWLKRGAEQQIVVLAPGVCVRIPSGVHFQFRSTGRVPLRFVLRTMPPWPGAAEAQRVADHWTPS